MSTIVFSTKYSRNSSTYTQFSHGFLQNICNRTDVAAFLGHPEMMLSVVTTQYNTQHINSTVAVISHQPSKILQDKNTPHLDPTKLFLLTVWRRTLSLQDPAGFNRQCKDWHWQLQHPKTK